MSEQYQLMLPIKFSSDSKTSTKSRSYRKKIQDTTVACTNLEQLIDKLNQSGQYKILTKYQKPEFYNTYNSSKQTLKKIGIFLDTETTGLSYTIDKILELGMVKFEYCQDGYIYKIIDEFTAYQDPKEPIAPHITELTGITNEMVIGQNIDQNEVIKFLKDASIIIAHNAQFDRMFFEKNFPGISNVIWGCSKVDINWRAEKFESQKLEYLAYKYNFFYEGHRAVTDCLAGLHLLAQILPISKQPVLKQLLINANKTRFKIWAKNAPYETKDLLKTRNYRWSTHPEENYKAWMIEVYEEVVESELHYLRTTIYNTPSSHIPINAINPINRFLDR